MEGGNY
jgi:hypothetical protein